MRLSYFKGKICSIFTQPINRNFYQENPKNFLQQNIMYFVGVVEDVDESGILFQNLQTGLKSFFFKNSLVAICEEEVLDPSNQQDAKVINEIKDKDKEIREMMAKYESDDNQGFIKIDQLEALIKAKK